jgi:hypothetical protein
MSPALPHSFDAASALGVFRHSSKIAVPSSFSPYTCRCSHCPLRARVNVVNWTVTKLSTALGASSEGNQLETHLSLTAWVKNIQYQKNVWIDFHVFDAHDNLVHSETVPLSYYQPGGGGGDLFIFDQRVLKGSGGLPGSVWPP